MKTVIIDKAFEFVRNGASIKQEDGKGGIPITRIETIWDSSIDQNRLGYADITDELVKPIEKYLLIEGDILMTHINSPKHLGKCAIYTNEPKQLIHGMNLLCLRSKADILFPKYALYFFNSEEFKAIIPRISNQSVNQASFSAGNLKDVQIPLPPLPTQKHIAAILDAADLYRQKTKNLVAKYDQLAQSLFLEMFGDPVRNEKGWEKKKLGDLTDIFSGSTPSRENEIFYIGNNPWIKTTELRGVIINDSQEKISDEALRNTSCRLYPKGTILIAMYGQGVTRGKVGILGIEAATNQACAALPPTNKINSEYLFSHLKFSYEELRELGRGGNQPNLNCGLVKSFEVLNPPLTLQTQFASRIQLIEAQKQQAQSTLQKSETLFNCLIQKAFKGELVS